MIAFRKAHPALRSEVHSENWDYSNSNYPPLSWHGTKAWNADWSDYNRLLAFMVAEQHPQSSTLKNTFVYVAMNMHWEAHAFELPGLPEGMLWNVFANTDMQPPYDIAHPGQEINIKNQTQFIAGPRSVALLVGR